MMLKSLSNGYILRYAKHLQISGASGRFLSNHPNFINFINPSSNVSNITRCIISKPASIGDSRFLAKQQEPLILGINHLRNSSSHAANQNESHVRLWLLEKLISVPLPLLLPAALITGNFVLETLLSTIVVMHAHWGLEAVVLDYARPIVVGNIIPKVAMGLLYLLSATTLAGLGLLIFNGPGISKTVKRAWKIGKKQQQ
ncbi:succinate dehydrogenase [ubiquinone] cytochrome b small subunit, mitochondrial [Prorops nasuta]|uniref:succinate dehydrogenase [ubiquinone] cytochrome b small subunit, mitochondrial n=1 Tax=Prorops nasuta TaxID=863751 RepID=UPI0034CD18A1